MLEETETHDKSEDARSAEKEIICVSCKKLIEEKEDTPKDLSFVRFSNEDYHKVCLEKKLKSSPELASGEIEIKIVLKAPASEILEVVRAIEVGSKEKMPKIDSEIHILLLRLKEEIEDSSARLLEIQGDLNNEEIQMTPQKRNSLISEKENLEGYIREREFSYAKKRAELLEAHNSTVKFENRLISVLAEYNAFYVRCNNHVVGKESDSCLKIVKKSEAFLGINAMKQREKEIALLSLIAPEDVKRQKRSRDGEVKDVLYFCCEECEKAYISRRKLFVKGKIEDYLRKKKEEDDRKLAARTETQAVEESEEAKLLREEKLRGLRESAEKAKKLAEENKVRLLEERRRKKDEVKKEFCKCKLPDGSECGKEVEVGKGVHFTNVCADHVSQLFNLNRSKKEKRCDLCYGTGMLRDEENPFKSEKCEVCGGKGFVVLK